MSIDATIDKIDLQVDRLLLERKWLIAAVDEALAYAEDREDVVDGAYGEPKPNDEMFLAVMLRNVLRKVGA